MFRLLKHLYVVYNLRKFLKFFFPCRWLEKALNDVISLGNIIHETLSKTLDERQRLMTDYQESEASLKEAVDTVCQKEILVHIRVKLFCLLYLLLRLDRRTYIFSWFFVNLSFIMRSL